MKSYQQGNADGLCGLYSILNFLMTLKDWKDEGPEASMNYILEAASAEGIFTPAKLTGGYRSDEIKAVLNRIFEQWRMPFQSLHLEEIQRNCDESNFDFHMRILEAGGSVIGGHDGREHWVLFSHSSEGPIIANSADKNHPTRPFNRRLQAHCSLDSVAILPRERAAFQIG